MHTKASTMKPVAHAAALVLAAGALAPAYAIEDYAMWDNFDGAMQIAPTKWLGFERHRMIEGGALRMIQRDHGSQPDNLGKFADEWVARLPNQLVKQIKATITVNAFDVSGCAGFPDNRSRTQAWIAGEFFNAGPGVPSSSNRTNDVGAVITVLRTSDSNNPPGLLNVVGSVHQCTTSDCNARDNLGEVYLGTATVGEAVTLRLDWDQPNKRFNFYRGSDPVKRVNYVVSDAQAPGGDNLRRIATRNELANCMAGRTSGFMDAKFDNVFVNASAAP